MRIAITGCSGYLGQLLVRRFNREGLGGGELLGLDLAAAPQPRSQLEFRRCDVRSADLDRSFGGVDVVIHLAFVVETMRDRALMYDVNLGGSRNVFSACERAGVPNLLVASSVAAYGVHGDTVITERTPLRGDRRSFYAHTKRLVEEELDLFEARNPSTRVVRMRPSVILGPRCNTWAIASMASTGGLDTRRGMRLPIVHEDDVTEAFWRALKSDVSGPLLVTQRHPLTGADLARLSGVRHRVVPERVLTALADASFAAGMSRMNRDWLVLTLNNRFEFDPTDTERRLGFRPRHSAEEALCAALRNARALSHQERRRAAAHVHRLEGTRFSIPQEDRP